MKNCFLMLSFSKIHMWCVARVIYKFKNIKSLPSYLISLYVCFFVCVSVSSSLHLVRFGQLIRCADNIMRVYVERNNLQVELIRFRKKYRLYSRLLLRSEEFNATSFTERNS